MSKTLGSIARIVVGAVVATVPGLQAVGAAIALQGTVSLASSLFTKSQPPEQVRTPYKPAAADRSVFELATP